MPITRTTANCATAQLNSQYTLKKSSRSKAAKQRAAHRDGHPTTSTKQLLAHTAIIIAISMLTNMAATTPHALPLRERNKWLQRHSTQTNGLMPVAQKSVFNNPHKLINVRPTQGNYVVQGDAGQVRASGQGDFPLPLRDSFSVVHKQASCHWLPHCSQTSSPQQNLQQDKTRHGRAATKRMLMLKNVLDKSIALRMMTSCTWTCLTCPKLA